MGYSTRYLGGPRIVPPLNQAEVAWLRAYTATRIRTDHPYDVPMNPGAGHLGGPHRPGAPEEVTFREDWWDSAGRDWEPTTEGCHLRWVPAGKSNDAARQIEYLIEHFLGPDAQAAHSGRPEFAEFSFDHVLSGYIATERDDGCLTLIQVRDNEIIEMVLVEGSY